MNRFISGTALLVVIACELVAQTPAAVAARTRQEAIRSIEYRYTIEEVIEAGAYQAAAFGGSGSFPAERLKIKSANRLVISGDKIRIENNHPIYSVQTNSLSKNIALCVSDGKVMKTYYGPPSGADRANSYGVIAFSDRGLFARDVLLLPLLLSCRGYDGRLCPVTFSKHLSGPDEKVRIGGHWCQKYSSSVHQITFWFDDTAHSLRRLRVYGRNGLDVQSDIEPQSDGKSGHVLPASWKQSHFTPTGKLRQSLAVTVTGVEINAEYSDGEFDQTFPTGIEVEDQRTEQSHLVRDDGSFRQLRYPGEDTTSTRNDQRSSWWDRNIGWMAAVVFVCLLALGVLAARRIKMRG
jgi:hypothetical protein